jgi:hypothetical protein
VRNQNAIRRFRDIQWKCIIPARPGLGPRNATRLLRPFVFVCFCAALSISMCPSSQCQATGYNTGQPVAGNNVGLQVPSAVSIDVSQFSGATADVKWQAAITAAQLKGVTVIDLSGLGATASLAATVTLAGGIKYKFGCTTFTPTTNGVQITDGSNTPANLLGRDNIDLEGVAGCTIFDWSGLANGNGSNTGSASTPNSVLVFGGNNLKVHGIHIIGDRINSGDMGSTNSGVLIGTGGASTCGITATAISSNELTVTCAATNISHWLPQQKVLLTGTAETVLLNGQTVTLDAPAGTHTFTAPFTGSNYSNPLDMGNAGVWIGGDCITASATSTALGAGPKSGLQIYNNIFEQCGGRGISMTNYYASYLQNNTYKQNGQSAVQYQTSAVTSANFVYPGTFDALSPGSPLTGGTIGLNGPSSQVKSLGGTPGGLEYGSICTQTDSFVYRDIHFDNEHMYDNNTSDNGEGTCCTSTGIHMGNAANISGQCVFVEGIYVHHIDVSSGILTQGETADLNKCNVGAFPITSTAVNGSNVLTVVFNVPTLATYWIVGQTVHFQGLQVSTFLNGQNLVITNISTATVKFAFTHTMYGTTNEMGSPTGQIILSERSGCGESVQFIHSNGGVLDDSYLLNPSGGGRSNIPSTVALECSSFIASKWSIHDNVMQDCGSGGTGGVNLQVDTPSDGSYWTSNNISIHDNFHDDSGYCWLISPAGSWDPSGSGTRTNLLAYFDIEVHDEHCTGLTTQTGTGLLITNNTSPTCGGMDCTYQIADIKVHDNTFNAVTTPFSAIPTSVTGLPDLHNNEIDPVTAPQLGLQGPSGSNLGFTVTSNANGGAVFSNPGIQSTQLSYQLTTANSTSFPVPSNPCISGSFHVLTGSGQTLTGPSNACFAGWTFYYASTAAQGNACWTIALGSGYGTLSGINQICPGQSGELTTNALNTVLVHKAYSVNEVVQYLTSSMAGTTSATLANITQMSFVVQNGINYVGSCKIFLTQTASHPVSFALAGGSGHYTLNLSIPTAATAFDDVSLAGSTWAMALTSASLTAGGSATIPVTANLDFSIQSGSAATITVQSASDSTGMGTLVNLQDSVCRMRQSN